MIEWYIIALVLIFVACVFLFGLTRSKALREVEFAEGIDYAVWQMRLVRFKDCHSLK
jgi:hypothetical protein